MQLGPRGRKALLVLHILVSVGWVGGVLAYLPFDVATVASGDPVVLRASYVAMDVIAEKVLVNLAFATVLTGVAISLLTPWGLFRHWWVLLSLALTILASFVLGVEVATIDGHAAIATDPATSDDALRALPHTLPHSLGGLAVLVFVLALNVAKPRGMTRYGWRRSRSVKEGGEGGAGRAQP